MINETYDSFISSAAPYHYWQFSVNGKPTGTGIDGTTLNSGDVVGFEFEVYIAEKHKDSPLRFKHDFQTAAAAKQQMPDCKGIKLERDAIKSP